MLPNPITPSQLIPVNASTNILFCFCQYNWSPFHPICRHNAIKAISTSRSDVISHYLANIEKSLL